MPWSTPTLRSVRELVRGEITSALAGASYVGNSVLRVLADAQAGLSHLVLRYIDWLARQLLPDTAETEWLDRHGTIWLQNADGSLGRKPATFAQGTVEFTGAQNTVVPAGTQLAATADLAFETMEQIIIGLSGPVICDARALDPGMASNIGAGETLECPIVGVDQCVVVTMTGGTDAETDDDLRTRILLRIQQPPMGGDAGDYTQWTLSVAGVTRAWAAPNEMGVGTVTVRFMEDVVRAPTGFPLQADIDAVFDYLDTVRPVTVKELFVEAPIAEPIDFTVTGLDPDDSDVRARITRKSVANMIYQKAAPARALNGNLVPAQTIYAAWVSQAIMEAEGVISFDLVMADHAMPHGGALAVMGTATFA